jgi:predicted nucleic acid-binding protein
VDLDGTGGRCLAETDGRHIVRNLLADLEADPRVELVLPEPVLWRRGVDLYADRPDKEWSLTDCLSFVIMKDRGLTDALTADHRFIQAGFPALLRPAES